tara:strand:- start:3084 stop:3503 length:420 start_codon:yes stop_codon:yes gene_type:complete
MSNFHTYSSWGRTRQPKNVTGRDSTSEAATLDAAPAGNAAADIASSFTTENQRFLHLLLDTDTSGENKTITVYGFSYAFARWAPLKDVRGNAVTISADDTSTYQIFEIHGVDRVCFLAGGTDAGQLAANDFFFAATSTF